MYPDSLRIRRDFDLDDHLSVFKSNGTRFNLVTLHSKTS